MKNESMSLMAIDNPDYLFKPLLKINEEISYKKYEEILVNISEEKITKGSTYVEMHMYWLTILGFLKSLKSKERTYKITDKGKRFLSVYDGKTKTKKYENFLHSEISRNEKTKKFYKKFLESIKKGLEIRNPKTLLEVSNAFPGKPRTAYGTARVMKMFCVEAGVVIDKNGKLGISHISEPKISLKKFKNELIKTYDILQNRQKKWVEPKPIYVEIGQLRDIVLCVLGITDNIFFDTNLQKLLAGNLGKKIHLYGSAPQWFTKHQKEDIEQLIFRHKGKIYVYLSIS